jgi:hypothetical protein
MSIRKTIGSILLNPRILLVANLAMFGYFFFMEIVVYEHPSSRLPYPILVIVMVTLSVTGWYFVENGSTKFERGLGYAALYPQLILSTLYFFGVR